MGLTVRVLGPIEVTIGDTSVDLGGALPRRLLTALAAASGQTVSDEALVEAIWGAERPVRAQAALQVHVSRLRAAFGPDGPVALKRDSVGYRLDADEVDAVWFADAVDTGRQLLADGRPAEAMTALSEGLALWRGEPYAELAGSDLADASRLTELREVAVEELAAARLSSGDASGAVADLEELVRAAPLRERRWALLVRALYRCGRQGDALAAVRKVRSVLADELGVDPGAELQDLELRVLTHDPSLGAAQRPQAVGRPLTSFLGREDELKAVTERLTDRRLVSLIGPAGVGKTRLAMEYMASCTDPAWFTRLADVGQPAVLPSVVANAVGLVAVHDDPIAAVIRLLRDQSGVLVLDNCEHIVNAAAELVLALTAGCPRLRILVTSREPLGVDGEVTVPLTPLAPAEAVDLLVDRVQAVRPGWTPVAEELAHARRISAALDGLPLAIELAAARARVFGLGEIAERLDDRFALLGPVPKGSLAAHATLEAAIGWSVDLLSPADRSLLLRLWPFEGGFTLQAAEAVGPGAGAETLESLSSLVSRSVVAADTTEFPTRYLLLESVRAYCRSLDPDPAGSRAGHARWVRMLAQDCMHAMRTKAAGTFLQAHGRELPNIRAGLDHDLAHDPVAALTSVAHFGLFFTRAVHNTEAIRWVRAAIAAAPDAPVVVRARAAVFLIALTDFLGDFEEARRLVAETADGVFSDLSDDHDVLECGELYYFLAFSSVETRHVDIALRQAEHAIDIGTRHDIGWVAGAGRTVHAVARALRSFLAGDVDAMVEAAQEAQRIARGWTRAWANAVLAETYLLHPDGPAAEALAATRTAVTVFHKQGDIPFALDAMMLGTLALARLGRPADAVRLRSGIEAHAQLLGFQLATFLAPDAGWVDDILAGLRHPADGAQLTWADLVDLLSLHDR